MSTGRFASRTAVVVGATEPIGRAVAELLLSQGAHVIGLDADAVECGKAQGELAQRHGGSLLGYLACEPADPARVAAVASEIAALVDRIDVLVYAATAMDKGGTPLLHSSLEEWHRIVDVNLTGVVVCLQALRPLLERSAAASVVIQASVDGHAGNPQVPIYSITKGGQVVMTHVLAAELAPLGIRVNCVAIAGVPIHRAALSDSFRANTTAQTPLKRPGRPDEIAGAIAFLASDDASFVSGSSLYVDGGRLAVTPGTLTTA